MTENYIKTLLDLASIKSVTGLPETRDAVLYIEKFFAVTGARVKKYAKNGRPSIVVSNASGLNFDLILSGHLDVVPAPESLFAPRIKDGKIYGRGTCDMKVGVAVMMEIMKEEILKKSKTKIALMLTTDEEIGGADGTGYLVNDIGYRAKFVLAPDGGFFIDEAVVASKGVLHIKLIAKGRSAHGSSPWLGDNALDKGIAAYLDIKKFIESLKYKDSGAKFGDSKDKQWKSTCVLGKLIGGEAVNQVPDRAEFYIDIRFTEDNDFKSLISSVNKIARKRGVEILPTGKANAKLVGKDDKYVRMYADSVKDIIGRKCKLVRSHGADDGRYFAALGIPSICARPNSGGQHSDKEWAEIKSIGDFYRILRRFVDKINSGSVD